MALDPILLNYAQLQQYHIHSSNYIYASIFVVGIVLLLLAFSYLLLHIRPKNPTTVRQSSNFFSGANPSILAHIFIVLYTISLILFGLLGMYIYYYELSPVSWTKLFNQVIVCNGSSSNANYIHSAYNQYKAPLSVHRQGTKVALLKSIGNFIGNYTSGGGKDIFVNDAFSMGDGSFICIDRPLLLDYRNLFSRHYPYIYFTLVEEMKTYIRISTVQFFSFSILTSAYFVTLSSLRATILSLFDVSSGGIFSTSAFILTNFYGISRLLLFPIIDLWSSGGFRISRSKIIEYFLSFQMEDNTEDHENTGRFSWIIGCLKHYITIIERLLFLVILSVMIGKIHLRKRNDSCKGLTHSIACSPGEIIPFLLLQQPKDNQIASASTTSSPVEDEVSPLLSYLKMLRILVFWNLVSHVAVFSLNLSFKQLSLVQHPVLADLLSFSIVTSELLSVLFLLLILSTIVETSSLFWRTSHEAVHDAKCRTYSKYNYGQKLDIKNPDDIEDTFEDINSASSIPRAVYKPPIDYELPVWAKEGSN